MPELTELVGPSGRKMVKTEMVDQYLAKKGWSRLNLEPKVEQDQDIDLWGMTINELRDYAADNLISLGDSTAKGDIIAAIEGDTQIDELDNND